jgi:hypothetical protein
MKARRSMACGFFAAAFATSVTVAAAAEPRAVIELFTSQGCSSCPAADKLLGEMAKDPSLIPLSLSIDYWDYLGWKDTLALAGHANRQKAYSHVRGDRDVYTPQVVVNGVAQALGNDREAIAHAIVQSHHNAAVLSVPVTLKVEDGQILAAAPAGKSEGASAEVWLCPFSKAVQVAIGRGENTGRTVTYHNVVRRWVKLGTWTGKAEAWSIPVADVKTATIDGVAVIMQSGTAAAPGAMLGAAMAALPNATAISRAKP